MGCNILSFANHITIDEYEYYCLSPLKVQVVLESTHQNWHQCCYGPCPLVDLSCTLVGTVEWSLFCHEIFLLMCFFQVFLSCCQVFKLDFLLGYLKTLSHFLGFFINWNVILTWPHLSIFYTFFYIKNFDNLRNVIFFW
jgi:hypothetical protein